MAQKVLTWSSSQLNNGQCNFHVPCLFFVFVHVFMSEFASGIEDVTFVLIYI